MSFRVEYKQDCPENCWECPCSVADSTTSVYCHALQKHVEVDPYGESIPLECKLVDTADLDFKIEKKYEIMNKDGAKACSTITLDSFTVLHYWISQTPNIRIIGSELNPLGREIKITYIEDLPNVTVSLPDSTPTVTSEEAQNCLKEDSIGNSVISLLELNTSINSILSDYGKSLLWRPVGDCTLVAQRGLALISQHIDPICPPNIMTNHSITLDEYGVMSLNFEFFNKETEERIPQSLLCNMLVDKKSAQDAIRRIKIELDI